MGARARLLAVALALPALAGCGDPLVVIGDAPGILRVVAGIPETAGAEIGPTATQTELHTPRGLAVDDAGILYVADHLNVRILSVTPSGAVEPLLEHSGPGEEPRMEGPDGLALDGAGGLVIADPEAHRVWRLDLATAELIPFAGTGRRGPAPDTVADPLDADIDTPVGVAVDGEGRIYFSEMFGHRVRRVESDGSMVTFAGDGLGGFTGEGGPADQARISRPAGLAVTERTLYIADSGNHRIRAIDLASRVIATVAGSGSSGFTGDGGPADRAALRSPIALAVSGDDGSLFMADRDNHRVRVVNLASGEIETFAGNGEDVFNGDLLAAGVTSLAAPQGLAFGGGAFLFISDTGHHLVRRAAVEFFTRDP